VGGGAEELGDLWDVRLVMEDWVERRWGEK